MTFELSSLALETQAACHLVHPSTEVPLYAPVAKGEDPESKPVQVICYGTASQQYRKAVDAMMKRAAKRGKRDATPEEMREQSVEFLVALSVRIENMTLEGKEVATAEAFRELYSDERYSWIKDQVNSFLANTGAFLKK